MKTVFLIAVCLYFISARRSLNKYKGRTFSTTSKPEFSAKKIVSTTPEIGSDATLEIDNSETSPSNPDDEMEIDAVPHSNAVISTSTVVARRGVTAIRRMKWMTTTTKKAEDEGDDDKQKFFDEDDDEEEEPPSRTTPIIGISLCLLLVSLSVGWMCCTAAETDEERTQKETSSKISAVVVQQPANSESRYPLETHNWAPGDFGIS